MSANFKPKAAWYDNPDRAAHHGSMIAQFAGCDLEVHTTSSDGDLWDVIVRRNGKVCPVKNADSFARSRREAQWQAEKTALAQKDIEARGQETGQGAAIGLIVMGSILIGAIIALVVVIALKR